jgi:predicted nucleic acid-binding protein
LPLPHALYLDPRGGEWSFDSSVLINAYHAADMLFVIMSHFARRAHLLTDVLRELDRGPTGAGVRRARWFTEKELLVAEDLQLYADLRRRWGSRPDEDRGEAACLVAARRHGWRLALDDRVGYRAALDLGVTCTRTPQLIVSCVRAGWWPVDDAWTAYLQLVHSGPRRLGPIPWNGRQEFEALCAVGTFEG